MIKLKIQKEPYWLSLGYGVKVKVKPCTSAIFYEAKAFMSNKVSELANIFKENEKNGLKDNMLPDFNNPIKREAYADSQLLLGLAIAGIMEWEGVFEADSEEQAPLTPNKIEELFSNFWVLAENFRNQYCGLQELLEAEKNASTPAQSGTSETGETTAKDVEATDSSVLSQNANSLKQP